MEEQASVAGKRQPVKFLDGSSDFVLTYEDKEGDWMLVGDVPWEYVLNYSVFTFYRPLFKMCSVCAILTHHSQIERQHVLNTVNQQAAHGMRVIY